MPAATANRTSVRWARWVRQATIAVATTITPTTTATQRCRTWALVSSVRVGKGVPPISGQSPKTSDEVMPPAVTFDPNISSANVDAAANVASSVKRWLAPRTGSRAG